MCYVAILKWHIPCSLLKLESFSSENHLRTTGGFCFHCGMPLHLFFIVQAYKSSVILQLSNEPFLNNVLVFFHPLNIGLCPFNDLLQSSSCYPLVILNLLPLKLLQLCRDNLTIFETSSTIKLYHPSIITERVTRETKNGKQQHLFEFNVPGESLCHAI